MHHAYLFANRMKVLVHDGIGVWLAAKLNAGEFVWRLDCAGTQSLTCVQLEALVALAAGGIGEVYAQSRRWLARVRGEVHWWLKSPFSPRLFGRRRSPEVETAPLTVCIDPKIEPVPDVATERDDRCLTGFSGSASWIAAARSGCAPNISPRKLTHDQDAADGACPIF